jgi:hypothetical protein
LREGLIGNSAPLLGKLTLFFFAKAVYHARNQEIVDVADEVFALAAPERVGGREDTIPRAQPASSRRAPPFSGR